ncbi:MAG: aminotransferase class V-fold PLP-dependent enzyme [Suipraeoptans sp.]
MIYLNQAASTFPKPQRVLDVHAAALSMMPAGQFRSSGENESYDTDSCRKKLGDLLGIKDYQQIFFTSGATMSSNVLICGLGLSNKHVITTATEHNSILRPLLNFNKNAVDIVPCDKNGNVDIINIENSIKDNTKAIIINHCSNVTGFIQDIKAIGDIAKKNNLIFIVDASQSAGCIPILVDEWNIDALIFTGHKSLFGPQGTGGYYISKELEFKPFMYGGTGLDSSRIYYTEGPYEYEVGTQNIPGIKALEAGVEYILSRQVRVIADKEQTMIRELYARLEEINGVKLYGIKDINRGPVLSFNVEGLKPSDVAYILQNVYSIIVRTGLHCTPLIHKYIGTENIGTVRVSISDLTTREEIDMLVFAIVEIAKGVSAI